MKTYTLSEIEYNRSKKFDKKHYKKCGSGTSITFLNTGIGLNIKVQCSKCLKIKDISDYDSW